MTDAVPRMTIGVIGGGTMGAGIAHVAALHGAEVYVVEVDDERARAAIDRITESIDGAAERGKAEPAAAAAAQRALTGCGSIDELPKGLDLVVEAVIEDAEAKQEVLVRAEARDPVVLASNTSSISIDHLARGLQRTDRFAGMHFFNPVWAIPLVEVIRGTDTSDETLAAIGDVVEAFGMEQAVINDAPGFATSRLGVLVGIEAIRMVEEGVASPSAIDTAMRLGYRHPMGPLMLGDLIGLDVRLAIAEHLASVYGSRYEPPPLLRTMVAEGRLGRKAGVGFYDWSSGSPEPIEEA